MAGLVLDRHQGLDPPRQVALHPVGRGDEHLGLLRRQAVAGAEADDARMLEEAADDALDPDVLRQPRHARPQAADAAHHQVDPHARDRRLVELADHPVVDERVHLGPDLAFAAGPGVGDLLVDQPDQRLADAVGRQRQLLQPGRPGVAGHEVERLGGVAPERRVAGEEGDVGVDAGRDRVVVAGAEVAVGAEALRLLAHRQRDLGVGLQVDEAVDHLRRRPAPGRAPSGCCAPRRSAP